MSENNDRTSPQEPHKHYSEQDVQQRFEVINKTMVEPGLYAEAIEAYKELIRDHPGSRWAASAYLAVAHCYHALGQEEDELDVLEDILRQYPDHVVAKRARGAIEALRARRGGEGPADADLHGALRRLTRQVERMGEGQQRRAWLGTALYVVMLVLLALTWSRARVAGRPPASEMRDLDRRVTALESALEVGRPRSESGASAQASVRADRQAPAVTVIPIEPPESKAVGRESPPAPRKQHKAVAPPAGARESKAAEPAKPRPTPAKPKAKAPLKPPAGAPPASKTYTVKEGDSLWVIARSQLGDARRVNEIARLNGLKAPYKVKAGTKLKLPPR